MNITQAETERNDEAMLIGKEKAEYQQPTLHLIDLSKTANGASFVFVDGPFFS